MCWFCPTQAFIEFTSTYLRIFVKFSFCLFCWLFYFSFILLFVLLYFIDVCLFSFTFYLCFSFCLFVHYVARGTGGPVVTAWCQCQRQRRHVGGDVTVCQCQCQWPARAPVPAVQWRQSCGARNYRVHLAPMATAGRAHSPLRSHRQVTVTLTNCDFVTLGWLLTVSRVSG